MSDSPLLEAHRLVEERDASYGDVVGSFDEIAQLFDLMVCEDDDPGDRVAIMLKAMKIVRRKHSPRKRDNYVDDPGYTALLWRRKEARDDG